ncbi:MAG: pscJ type export protein [Planctomycetota bacterium]
MQRFAPEVIKSSRSLVAALLLLIAISGCSGRVELFGGLSEKECNEMLAILGESDIQAMKISDGEKTFGLQVWDSELSSSIVVLRNAGYPRSEFQGISEEFPQTGLISSPYQERIRYMHALSEELALTVTKVDGVIDARVHIVLPESTAFGEQMTPSSASVFIKHSSEVRMENVVPEIKDFVANSVEGLDANKVAVVLVESVALKRQIESASQAKFERVFNVEVRPNSAAYLRNLLLLLAGTGGINLVLAVASTLLCIRARKKLAQIEVGKPSDEAATNAAAAA